MTARGLAAVFYAAPQLPCPARCFGQYSTQQQQHARGLQRKKFMQMPINAYLRAHELKGDQAAQANKAAHKGYTPRFGHFLINSQ
jgi:hypothetical protein